MTSLMLAKHDVNKTPFLRVTSNSNHCENENVELNIFVCQTKIHYGFEMQMKLRYLTKLHLNNNWQS